MEKKGTSYKFTKEERQIIKALIDEKYETISTTKCIVLKKLDTFN